MSNAQVEESLVAFWNFDDGTGKTAKDSSENELDGELVGGPKWVEGKIGKALEFDGGDDYVEVSDISTPPILTFACWFQKTGSGNGGVPRLHSRGTGPWSLEYGVGNSHQPNQLEFYLAFSDGSTTGWTPFFEPKETFGTIRLYPTMELGFEHTLTVMRSIQVKTGLAKRLTRVSQESEDMTLAATVFKELLMK